MFILLMNTPITKSLQTVKAKILKTIHGALNESINSELTQQNNPGLLAFRSVITRTRLVLNEALTQY